MTPPGLAADRGQQEHVVVDQTSTDPATGDPEQDLVNAGPSFDAGILHASRSSIRPTSTGGASEK